MRERVQGRDSLVEELSLAGTWGEAGLAGKATDAGIERDHGMFVWHPETGLWSTKELLGLRPGCHERCGPGGGRAD